MERFDNEYGLMNIRNRILIFALLITLIPSFGMGWLLNQMMQATVTEKSEQKLRHTTNLIEREIALWFKERNYDLYVFSNSFVISENYGKFLQERERGGGGDAPQEPAHIRMIETYLGSVQDQFEDYTRLMVFDAGGKVIAVSHSEYDQPPPTLPTNLDEQIAAGKYLQGQVYFAEEDGTPRILIGTPLYAEQYENYVGILAIEVKLQGILEIVEASLIGIPWESEVYGTLVRLSDGRHFLSTEEAFSYDQSIYSSSAVLGQFDGLLGLHEFVDYRGTRVVGILSPLALLDWGIIVAENYEDVFARVVISRNRNILTVCVLGLVIGILAYLLARQIITPLNSLTRGAQRVADGDLGVVLPVRKNDELGLATRVFNEMVAELKQSQAKLEQLATTDSLTGLVNRKQIMGELSKLFDHYQRYFTGFAILMVDVDHFKEVNDRYGHQTGDRVLTELGQIFKRTLRNVDTAGRYGGEEFLILLAEAEEQDARHVAERIRQAVEKTEFNGDSSSISVTVSIGVAIIFRTDEDESGLVKRADKALYEAKKRGRNCCVYLPGQRAESKDQEKVVRLKRSAEK